MQTIDIIIGIVSLTIILGSIIGAFIYKYWKRAHYPKTWIHIGTPPAHVDLALGVIKSQLDKEPKRWGGTITWVDGPFQIPSGGLETIMAAGCVDSFEEPRIRLTLFKEVEQTALAHELCHVYNMYPDGDQRLNEFVSRCNTLIKIQKQNMR